MEMLDIEVRSRSSEVKEPQLQRQSLLWPTSSSWDLPTQSSRCFEGGDGID